MHLHKDEKMPEQKPIKFTELFHFSEPTNAKIKLNRNNTTFPAWDLPAA